MINQNTGNIMTELELGQHIGIRRFVLAMVDLLDYYGELVNAIGNEEKLMEELHAKNKDAVDLLTARLFYAEERGD